MIDLFFIFSTLLFDSFQCGHYFTKGDCANLKDNPLNSAPKLNLKDSLVYQQLQPSGQWEALGSKSLSMNGQYIQFPEI